MKFNRIIASGICAALLLTGCSSSSSDEGSFSVEGMNEKLLESAKTLPKAKICTSRTDLR